MRIVTADDHEVVRIGLRTLLQQGSEGYEVVGEAANGRELLGVLARTVCDLVIVDFLMQNDSAPLDGVVLLRELRRRYPKLRILVLTMLRNPAIVRTMYQEGVDAVVEKGGMAGELMIALRTVRAGRSYVPRHFQERLADGLDFVTDKRADRSDTKPILSAREAEVVRMFVQGHSLTDIAATTHRSIKTISRQKRNAMVKLSIDNDSQLFEYARLHGLYGE